MKKIFVKFLIMQLTAVIPFLIISVIISRIASARIGENRDNEVKVSMENAQEAFIDRYITYSSKAFYLLNASDLAKKKMTGSPLLTYTGVSLLKNELDRDLDIKNLMICYGTDRVYAATGVASISTFFSSTLDIDGVESKDPKEYYLKLLNSEGNRLAFLGSDNSRNNGYVVLSYRSDRQADTDIYFFFSYGWLLDIFQPEEGSIYCLTLYDGSEAVIGNNGKQCYFLTEDEKSEWVEKADVLSVSSDLSALELQITQYYSRYSSEVGHWIQTNRTINWILILAGMTLSAVISWIFTRENVQQIKLLRQTIQGEATEKMENRGILVDIQKDIIHQLEEKQYLQASIISQEKSLQNKISNMILGGLYRNYDELENAFRELHFDGCPEKYCIAVLHSAPLPSIEMIREVTASKLVAYTRCDDEEVIAYLLELESDDANRIFRNDNAMKVRTELHRNSIAKVRLGFSPCVSNPMIIESVYSDALRALRACMQSDCKSFCTYWESMAPKFSGYELPATVLQEFREALEERKEPRMAKAFDRILDSIPWNCSFPNKMYLRHLVTNQFIQCIGEASELSPEGRMIKEALIDINVENSQEYSKVMHSLIKRYSGQAENENSDSSFARMTGYIAQHFMESDLTFEKVSEVGGISKSYISKVFKANVNMSYIEYLTRVRINNACRLLRESNMSMEEITAASGFGTESNFRRVFKEKMGGRTPAEYRRDEKNMMDA